MGKPRITELADPAVLTLKGTQANLTTAYSFVASSLARSCNQKPICELSEIGQEEERSKEAGFDLMVTDIFSQFKKDKLIPGRHEEMLRGGPLTSKKEREQMRHQRWTPWTILGRTDLNLKKTGV